MIYCDLHCDTVTVCADNGLSLRENGLQVSLEKLKENGCLAQCFAIFTEGENAYGDFFRYLSFYSSEIGKLHDIAVPVKDKADFTAVEKGGKVGCILTVENLGFTGGDIALFDKLKTAGVKCASLVWNNKNVFASPNIIFENGLPVFEKRCGEGLTRKGKDAVARLSELGILVDVSHLSDGGVEDVLKIGKGAVIATHSNTVGVKNVSRNLTDEQIKKIADSGGVVGINFCKDFLGEDAFLSVAENVKRLYNVGGEDVLAFGSDFDGIPPYEQIKDCLAMPKLLEYLSGFGIRQKVLEKLCYKNFLRIFGLV